MAALTITPADVLKSANGAQITGVTAGASLTQGTPVYQDSQDQKYKVATNNDTEAKAKVVGIAANAAEDGQPLAIITQDASLDIGATITEGVTYVLGNTGDIQTIADNVSTEYVTILGVGTSTANTINFRPFVTGTVTQ